MKKRTTPFVDLNWPSWAPFEFTDPWTGETSTIYPSSHPDTYPLGYFGSGGAARSQYLHPDVTIDNLRFQISQLRELMQRSRGYDLLRDQETIARWEAKILSLQCPERRLAEARRLLAYRAPYIDKLTPRYRAMIDAENRELQSWIDAAE